MAVISSHDGGCNACHHQHKNRASRPDREDGIGDTDCHGGAPSRSRRVAGGARAGAEGRDGARLLGAWHRPSDRRRSRKREILVSPRTSPSAARQHGGRRNRRTQGVAQARDAVTAPKVLAAHGIKPEIAVPAIPDDERVWVPQAPDVSFRPLLLNTVTGGWCNLLRVRKSGILSRHRHPMVVVGYVIKGRWKYLEHDWTAEEGSFIYEPPGEIHTL